MLNFVTICFNELNETGECWIEKNSFGDIFEDMKIVICAALDNMGYQYELAEFNGTSYNIRLVQ